MTTYILDSSALLRYIDDEAGAERVEIILAACISGDSRAKMSAVQWGEIAGTLRRHHGPKEQNRILSSLPSEIEVVPVTPERAVRAAELRVDRKISYADAFALGLAQESSEFVLITSDYGFKSVADLVPIEFLPAK
jgi:predicted nucleic acid-binding protein